MLKINAPAKINIGLRICGQRADGYHLLESIFQKITLFDHISLEERSGPDVIHFYGKFGEGIRSDKNTILTCLTLLRSKFPQLPYFEIKVEKNIPHGAGLGGGSSDAGTLYRELVKKYDLQLNHEEELELLLQIGADVPFFATPSSTALVEGIGEKITPVNFLEDYQVFLYFPGYTLETARVYKKFDLSLTQNRKNIIFKSLFGEVRSLSDLSSCFFNDLEGAVFQLQPQLEQIKMMLVTLGCSYAQVSGSGTVVYGLHAGTMRTQNFSIAKGYTFHCKPYFE